MRADYWRIVAATPIALIMSSIVFGGGWITGLVVILFSVAYIYALRRDAQYVQTRAGAAWPNVRLYTVFGFITLLTFGVLSYLLSPYYLYKRRKVLS